MEIINELKYKIKVVNMYGLIDNSRKSRIIAYNSGMLMKAFLQCVKLYNINELYIYPNYAGIGQNNFKELISFMSRGINKITNISFINVNIYDNKLFNNSIINEIAYTTPRFDNLTTLRFNGYYSNIFYDNCLNSLINILLKNPKSKLTTFIIQECIISYKCLINILDALIHNCTLEKLTLGSIFGSGYMLKDINDEIKLSDFRGSLCTRNSSEHLEVLQNNSIYNYNKLIYDTKNICKYIENVFKYNKTLKYVCLSNNKIDNKDIKYICRGLYCNSTIKKIVLNGIDINNCSFIHFEPLLNNQSKHNIDKMLLHYNRLSTVFTKKISNLLVSNNDNSFNSIDENSNIITPYVVINFKLIKKISKYGNDIINNVCFMGYPRVTCNDLRKILNILLENDNIYNLGTNKSNLDSLISHQAIIYLDIILLINYYNKCINKKMSIKQSVFKKQDFHNLFRDDTDYSKFNFSNGRSFNYYIDNHFSPTKLNISIFVYLQTLYLSLTKNNYCFELPYEMIIKIIKSFLEEIKIDSYHNILQLINGN